MSNPNRLDEINDADFTTAPDDPTQADAKDGWLDAAVRRLPAKKCGTCGGTDDVRETWVSDDSREMPDLDSLPVDYCAKCRAEMESWHWNLVTSEPNTP